MVGSVGINDPEIRVALVGHGIGEAARSEEHTSELQSPCNLVCRLLLEKKKLNLFSRSMRNTNKRKSKHSAMLRNKETRHRMFIGLLNTTRKLAYRRLVSSINIIARCPEIRAHDK